MSFSTCPEYGYDPHSKGRWYRIKLVSDGTNLSMPECDIHDSVVTNKGVALPPHFVAMDLMCDIYSHSFAGTASAAYPVLTIGPSGKFSIIFDKVSWFDSGYLYVYGYCKP